MKEMKIFKNKLALNKELSGIKNIAFVPTMGGLHQGHAYIIKEAKKNARFVIVSIYVNPKQFNSIRDFDKYPRNNINDFKLLRELEVNYVYIPNFKDIYSFKTKKKIYLNNFSKKLCGKYRKNHFRGVIDVVNRFIEIIKPKFVILGMKDFQQLYLIKKHIEKRKIKIKIIECKTIREKNGLAYSSRNKKLTKKQKKIGSLIYKLLKNEKNKIIKNRLYELNIKEVTSKILSLGIKKIDYIKCLDLKSLKYPKNNLVNFNIFIAYYIKKIRLIDNI